MFQGTFGPNRGPEVGPKGLEQIVVRKFAIFRLYVYNVPKVNISALIFLNCPCQNFFATFYLALAQFPLVEPLL